jgi:methionyl-tRNA synthetase
VQKLFSTLYEKGFIYLASYTGSYCVSDEAFIDAPVGTPCPDCGRLLEEVTEENFFFKLSAFQAQLIDLIESNTLLITPDSSRNEVLSFIRGGLKDLSISRSSFTWGIPVPEPAASTAAQKHVIYVWLDALANYMTALGYGSDDETNFKTFWLENEGPSPLHLVGKEITRFHCIYWPAFLLAAGLPLPKQITAHGWLLFDNSKMSKSKGNIVRTETILSAFGTLCPPVVMGEEPSAHDRDLFAADVLRYYLLREIPFGQDGSFSFEALITRYNADLANGYGNLVSRTLTMIGKYFDFVVPATVTLPINSTDSEISFTSTASTFISSTLTNLYTETLTFESASVANIAMIASRMASTVDLFLTEQAPWRNPAGLSDQDIETRKGQILYTAAESIRIITALLYPILPYATARVWAQLGLGDIELAAREGKLTNLQWGGLQPGTRLGPLGPIFPRADKGLAQIMTNTEEQLATGKLETGTPATETPTQPATTDPAAAPRTTTLAEPALTVAGSHATTTGPLPDQPAPTLDSPQIAIDDFIKIDLRVAQVTLCERIPKADKLLRLEVDLGPLGQRQILSGIAEWYTPEEMVGRRIIVIANLAPRKMRGLESHGMLLAASEEAGKPYLATVPEGVPTGTRLK